MVELTRNSLPPTLPRIARIYEELMANRRYVR